MMKKYLMRAMGITTLVAPMMDMRSRVTIVRDGDKIGRNDKCGCGSGKKYKKCCMNKLVEIEKV